MKRCACIDTLYTEIPFEDRFAAAKRDGFESVEFWDWRIRDLNSTNGTLVNDVDVDECPLRDGDLITLGLTNLEFREN